MQPPPVKNNNQIISYLTLRTLIGALGILLPLLLIITNFIVNKTFAVENSISDYYDNAAAGDVLVGVLFVLGFFLLSYKGYERIDDIAASLGCVFALGIALFPTTSHDKLTHTLHFIFAFFLFADFIFFSLYLFRKSDKYGIKTQQKKNRNKVYLICGIIMIFCVAAIAACSFINAWAVATNTYNLIFWFETIALASFGFSWIVKGELLWKDAITGGDLG